jgi:serralysin
LGSAGADWMLDTGGSNDTVSYASSPSRVEVTLDTTGEGFGRFGDAEGDRYNSIRDVIGSSFNDIIIGNPQNNALNGGLGDDRIEGSDGDDQLIGGLGNDILLAGNQSDTLDGGDGNDLLTGGGNDDILYGGSGADTFKYDSLNDSLPGYGADSIFDFRAALDKINLQPIDANNLTAINDGFIFIGKNSFTNIPGQLRYVSSGNHTSAGSTATLYGDVNGDSIADFQINLTMPDAYASNAAFETFLAGSLIL